MSNKKCCCPTDVKPAVNDYKGTGSRIVSLEGLGFDMYVTGSGDNAILFAYDIFGLTPNVEQVADQLATLGGFLVVVPDFMRGQQWHHANVPPTKEGKFPDGVEPADGPDCLFTWVMTHPNCKVDRNEEISKIKKYLVKEYGIKKLGMTGFCWGGKVAFLAGTDSELVQAIATCHGSLLEKTDVEAVKVPVCMLDSKEEPEAHRTEFQPILESKPFADKNMYKLFSTMHHGWMGTRGIGSVNDFEKAEVQKCWKEALADLVTFFTNVFSE